MSEFSDQVRGVRELPLFPLPVVLFPGTPLPLHIFEPRYRQLFKDIQVTNNLFGMSFFDASESNDNRPETGSYGCAAELRQIETLEDGRSNVLSIGVMRYQLDGYADNLEPYFTGEVTFFEDDAEDHELLEPRARAVKDLFVRTARAVRDIAGERQILPELPEVSPEQLSYFIASAIDFDVKLKYEMLKMRSTSERLRQLHELLTQAVAQVEARAGIAKAAKTNGHSTKKIDLP